eukprot:6042051-Pyramimonas_sp.AAC.1
MGPDSRDLLWKDPEAKFLHRASLWANYPLGLHCSALAYNTDIGIGLCGATQRADGGRLQRGVTMSATGRTWPRELGNSR